MTDSIFTPHFEISAEIQAFLDDIERQSWLIDNMLLMPKHEAWIRRDIQVKRASGTTQIEGANLDEAAVSKLVNRTHAGKATADEQANINALQAYEFIDFLSDHHDIPLDELVVRQLNRYILTAAPEHLTPGAYRKGLNTVGNFTPPDQGDVPSLMRSFALWFREDGDMHPVVKAGIAHIHLVAIHPFWDGNGRTARGLSTLVMQRSRFGFRKLLFMESHLFATRDSYFMAIEQALGSRFEIEYDATKWLEFFTATLWSHVEGLMAMLTDWHRMMKGLYSDLSGFGLSQRQADGFAFATQAGQMTRSDYVEITGVSPVTASRDLARLVEKGALVAEGKTRSRIYRPAPSESDSKKRAAGGAAAVARGDFLMREWTGVEGGADGGREECSGG